MRWGGFLCRSSTGTDVENGDVQYAVEEESLIDREPDGAKGGVCSTNSGTNSTGESAQS